MTKTTRKPQPKRVWGLHPDLTPRELALLTYAAGVIDASGVQPTYRQQQEVFGYKSLNSIAEIIRSLRRKGVIWQTSGHGFAFDWKAYLRT